MLKIPEYVPKDLVEDLEKIQFQLKILLRNYKVGLVVIYALHCMYVMLHMLCLMAK